MFAPHFRRLVINLSHVHFIFFLFVSRLLVFVASLFAYSRWHFYAVRCQMRIKTVADRKKSSGKKKCQMRHWPVETLAPEAVAARKIIFHTKLDGNFSYFFSPCRRKKKKNRDKNNNEENVKRECLCAWNEDIQNDIYERNLSSRSRQPSAWRPRQAAIYWI